MLPMKIIIAGAGKLGRLLASVLCKNHHDVVILDNDPNELQHLSDTMDIMTVEGSCSSISALKRAGAVNAQVLLAVSGDEAANILTCQLASKLGVKHTICRLYSSDCFSEEDGITSKEFGIWRSFSSPEESAKKIEAVVDNPILMERIRFSNKSASMVVFEITKNSELLGIPLKTICEMRRDVKKINFAAILRDHEVLLPRGNTIFVPGDRVYAAGRSEDVDAFITSISAEDAFQKKTIIISGSNETGILLAKKLAEKHTVRMIEKDLQTGNRLLDQIPDQVFLFHGEPTDQAVLEEAGISNADVFISTDTDDEDNILSCVQAKHLGARKVISLTYKPEYVRIISEMNLIDCGFSSTLIAGNTILRLLESGTMRLDAMLQQLDAILTEFKIRRNSPLCGIPLRMAKPPTLALVFRDGEVLQLDGETVLQEGDTAVTIVMPDLRKKIEYFFPEK